MMRWPWGIFLAACPWPEKAKGSRSLMTSQHKIRVDRMIGGPLSYVLNVLARLLGVILRRGHGIPQHPGVICVAKFAGMGNIIASLPMLQALKAEYPAARLVFVTSTKNSDLVERIGLVDRGLYVSERSILGVALSTLGLLWKLWSLRPSLYIDLELYSYFASIVATLSCARNRLGFYRKSTSVKRGLFTHLVFFNTAMPVQELYLQLARTAGCKGVPTAALAPPVVIRDGDREEARRRLEGWVEATDRLLVVNPNASDLCLERRWPRERFASAIKELLDRSSSLKVALVGSREERGYVSGLERSLSDRGARVRNLAGELSLGGFMALLERADCLLTNDSGPMHLAFVLGRPTVALFGPVHPFQYVQDRQGSGSVVLYEPVLCSPCLHQSEFQPCGGDNQCMKMIRVESVVQACVRMLFPDDARDQGDLPQAWRRPKETPAVLAQDGTPLGRIVLRKSPLPYKARSRH